MSKIRMLAKKKAGSHVDFQDGCYVRFDSSNNVSSFVFLNIEQHDHSTFHFYQNKNVDPVGSESLGQIAYDYIESFLQ